MHLVDGIARAKRRRRSVSVLIVPSFTCVSKLARHLAAACSQACLVGKPVFVSGAGFLGMVMTKVQLNNTSAAMSYTFMNVSPVVGRAPSARDDIFRAQNVPSRLNSTLPFARHTG